MEHKLTDTNILFLDIETVPQKQDFNELDSVEKALWLKKAKSINRDDLPDSEFYKRAGIYAEFGKIICISIARIVREYGSAYIAVESFSSHNERRLLKDFCAFLSEISRPTLRLCAHNGKEFDFPYIARRCLIRGLALPEILNTQGKKPWEVQHLDTMEMWKFGDWKAYTSLDLLAHVFDLRNPKAEISGSDVCDLYWKENDLDRIVRYCEGDVLSLLQVYLRMTGAESIAFNESNQYEGAA